MLPLACQAEGMVSMTKASLITELNYLKEQDDIAREHH
jgi:hypothetical protein